MARDILIVDDEADIRLLIAGILRDEGFEPREAGDSDAALDGGDGRFDVAVAGDHHDREVGMLALDRVEERQPVHPAAL